MRDAIRISGKRLASFLKLLGQSVYSLLLVSIFSKWFLKPFKRNERENCIILGNGPSLTTQLEQIRALRETHSLLSVNSFPFSELFDEFKPEYYTFVDPYYWFIVDGQVPDVTERLFRAFSKKVTWPIVLIIPYEMETLVRNDAGLQANKNISFSYFNRTPVSGLRFTRLKMYDSYLGIPAPNNVLIAAIYLMIHAAHKQILLFGTDHSWHEQLLVSSDNILRVREDHFVYEKDSRSISDSEELHEPIYKFAFNEDGTRQIFKIHEIFAIYSNVHKAYWELNDYAQYMGTLIVNMSNKSYIDAFKRGNN